MAQPPVRYPSGVNTSLQGNNQNANPFRQLPMPDRTRTHEYFNDFDVYTAGDWTITDVGTEGQLLLTTGSAGTDSTYLQNKKLSFYLAAGRQAWFEARFQLDSATLSNFVIGLQAQDTTPLAVSDGVYFIKASGAATVDAIVTGSSTATTASAVGTVTAATWMRLSWYYNGKDAIEVFVDHVKVATMAVTNLPSAGLTLSFGVAASTAVARTATIDYIWAVSERYTANSP
jgi:hypothetical protein